MLLPSLVRRLVLAPVVVVFAVAFIVLSPALALLALVFGLAALVRLQARPGRMRSLRLTCFALIWFVTETAALFMLLGLWLAAGLAPSCAAGPAASPASSPARSPLR